MTQFPLAAELIARIGWTLLHSVWQFAFIALIALLLDRVLRPSAVARYWSLICTLCGLLVVSVATFRMIHIDPASTSPATAGQSVPQVLYYGALSREYGRSAARGQNQSPNAPPQGDATAMDPSVPPATSFSASGKVVAAWVQPWLSIIVAGWCIGVFVCAGRPLLSWYTVRRLRRVGTSAVPESIHSLLAGTSERMRLRQSVAVLQSTLIQIPLVIGYLKPVILLPASIISGLDSSQLESILAHELAHIRRQDYMVNVLQTLIETVFFYHPAVWWISSQIRIERENCCDDIAVAVIGNRVTYGRALLALEEWRTVQTAFAISVNGGSLLARVRRLFVNQPVRSQRSASSGIVVALLIVSLAGVAWSELQTPQQARAQQSRQSAPSTIAQTPSTTDRGDSKGNTQAAPVTLAQQELPDAKGKPADAGTAQPVPSDDRPTNSPVRPTAGKTAPGSLLDKAVAIRFPNPTLHAALAEICAQAGADLELDRDGLKAEGLTMNMRIRTTEVSGTVREALEGVLGQFTGLSFTRIGKTVYVGDTKRVEARDKLAVTGLQAKLELFSGTWSVLPGSSTPAAATTFQINGREFSRLTKGQPNGTGTLQIDPYLSPATFTLQFTQGQQNTGYLSGTYEFRADGSVALQIPQDGDHPPEGPVTPAVAQRLVVLQKINSDSTVAPGQRKSQPAFTPPLEFRCVANRPESELEPRLPADYLQLQYRDASRLAPELTADKGFAWFPFADAQPGGIQVPIERTVGKQRMGLLSDTAEHALLSDGTWAVRQVAAVPDPNGQDNYSIQISLNQAAEKAFRELTRTHLNQPLAIVIGGTIVAAPIIRNELGAEVVITGRFSKAEAEQLAATISADGWKEVLDCTCVDSQSGQPIPGQAFTIHFRFEKPTLDPDVWETVDNLVWGPKSSGKVQLIIPPRVLRHPDFDKMTVRWGVSHPDYETTSAAERVSVKTLVDDDPKSARDGLRQLKLPKKSAK